MRRRIAFAIALGSIGCGRIAFSPLDDAATSTDSTRRNQIDIHGAMLGESLVDFPLHVRLRAPAFDRGAARLDGADLRFFGGDQATKLVYEIEHSSEEGFDLWVRIPDIEKGREQSIFVTYGDPDAEPGERREDVWSSEHIAVWHLGDGRDSTANHLDGTFTGTVATTGIAGLGRDMQLGFLEIPDAPALAAIGANGTATWSAWAKPVSLPDMNSALIDRQHEGLATDDFRFGPTSSGDMGGQITIDPGAVDLPYGGVGSFAFGTWTLFAMVRDGAALHVGMNGVTLETNNGAGTVHASANPVWIGAGCNSCSGVPVSDRIEGVLDEARIYSVARTDGWLRAEYLNLTDSLVTVQPFELP